MNRLAQTLLHNWHIVRIIYLIISLMLLAQAWQTREWAFGLVGGLFLYQSLLNTGCCGMSLGSGQNIKINETSERSLHDTEYTEIK
jgi:hypothetical protein